MPWDKVPCHSTVHKNIIRAISRGIFGRTSLIYGPPGAGQSQVAKAIVMTYVCQMNQDDFCGECPNCRKIEQGIYPDVIEMHPWEDWSEDKKKLEKRKQRKKNQYSVAHMRVMQEQALHLPFEGEKKYFIIHDAHCMNESSSNSLLKILEEPHDHIRFLLLSDRVSGILPTIRSRCWAVRLMPLEIASLAQSLPDELSSAQATAIARAAGGLPEQAHKLIEEGYLEKRDWMLEFLLKIKQKESYVVDSADQIAKARNDLPDNLTILFRIVRDGIVELSGGDSTQFENPDRKKDLKKLWQGANIDQLTGVMERILDALNVQERYVNPTSIMMDLLLDLRLAISSH